MAAADDPPPADSSDEPVAPAVARHEPFAYTPDVKVDDGVVTGTNTASRESDWHNPLTYTVVGDPVAGGKVNLDDTKGNFTFLPHSSQLKPGGVDQFSVLVAETTWFDSALERVPVLGYLVKPILVRLHQVPILKDLLAPLIGRSMVVPVVVEVGSFVGEDKAPIAFTTTVTSFDGTPISVNWFPKSGLTAEGEAPTILNGPSLATAGYTDPKQETTVFGLVPGLAKLRPAGYNVVTWDPRGEFASGGILHLDSENFEARDVSAIIDWVDDQPHTEFDDPADTTDPRIGMLGGSYGGGIQLTSAGIDSRIDAIAPGIAWNRLDTALYPNHAFKTSWASLLLLSLVVSGSRIDSEIYAGIATGVLTGFLTRGQQDFLSENSPSTVIEKINIPTLFLQGTVDGLFTLQEALNNAEGLGDAAAVKMIWYCGGHGDCLDLDDEQQARQTKFLVAEQLAWMDKYVKRMEDGAPIDGYKFSWIDQRGELYSSYLLPTDGTSFYGPSIPVSGSGGLLPILPLLGGSGPQRQSTFPVSITLAAPARDALNIAIPTPAAKTYLVGAPELTLTYAGLGTSRNIYAQIVDLNTGRTLGNLVTPIPVRLDGGTHTVTVSMENIAYTAHPADNVNPGDKLALQIVDSATAYENFSSFGVVHVSGISLTLPTAANVIPRSLPPYAGETKVTKREPQTLQDLILGALPR